MSLLGRVLRKLKRDVPFYFVKVFFKKDHISGINIEPYSHGLQVIGGKSASWVIPKNLLTQNAICYCVGCGEDISFDLALIEKYDCDVFAFDPTPRAISHVKATVKNNSKYHFFDFGLWDSEDVLKFFVPKKSENVSHSLVNLQKTEDYIEVKVKRLSQVMDELHHKQIDLLKLDIEGAEYKVLDSIISDNIDIKIICVEYDEYHTHIDEKYKQRIHQSAKKLIDFGYKLICSEGNGNYTFIKR